MKDILEQAIKQIEKAACIPTNKIKSVKLNNFISSENSNMEYVHEQILVELSKKLGTINKIVWRLIEGGVVFKTIPYESGEKCLLKFKIHK